MKSNIKRLAALTTLLLLFVGMASGYGSFTGKDFEYPFEGSCPAEDTSGNGNDGSCVNDVQTGFSGISKTDGNWDYDSSGSPESYDFDSEDAVDTGITKNYDKWTLSAWVKPDNAGNSFAPVITKGGTDNNDLNFRMVVTSNDYKVEWMTSGSVYGTNAGVSSINNDEWTHIVSTYTGNYLVFYVDGSKVKNYSVSQNPANTGDAIFVGARRGNSNNQQTLNGQIDEPRTYDYALSSSQVNNLYTCNSESCNQPPSFDNVVTEPSSWTLGSSVNVSANVSDDSQVSSVSADVWENGTQIQSGVSLTQQPTGEWTASNLFNVDEKSVYYNVTLTATDDDGATSTYSDNQFIDDSAPTVSISKPKDQNYTSKKVNYSFSASDSDDIPGESFSCELFNNGNSFKNVSGTEPVSDTGNITSSIHDPQSNTFKVECDDGNGNTGSLTQSYYIWRGLNVSAFQKDTGNNFTSWNLYLSNSTQNFSSKNLSNPGELEYDIIPNGNVTVTVGDGENGLYYFNKTFYRQINSSRYYQEDVDLKAKPENPLTLDFSPGLLMDEGEEVTVDGTPTQGTGTLERDGAVVSNPYQATLSEGVYNFNFSIGETQDYAPNYKSSTLQVLAAGEGCTSNRSYAFQKDVNPTTNPYLVDFSDFVDSDRVRPNLGDVYTNTTNVSLKRTGSSNELLYVNTTGYSGSEVDLEWGNYYVNKSYSTTSKPGSADQNNLSTFNEQNPYYVLTYKLEQSQKEKLPPGGNTTATLLCDSGATGYKVKDERYLVAAKEKLNEIKHTVQYSSTDIYQRNLLPTSKVEYRTVWLVDANDHQVVELLLELIDNTGKYDDSFIRVKKAIGGSERTITEQYFDAEQKTVGYLINGEKYSVEIVSTDRSDTRSIGNLYVDTVDLTKTIRINSKFDIDPDSGNVSYNLYRSGSSINLDFAFPDGQVGKAELKIYNYSNGKQQQKIYEDSLSNKSSGGLTWNYNSSQRKNQSIQAEYLINSSKFGEIKGSQLFDIGYSSPLKNLNVDADTLKAFAVFMIIVIPMFFNPSIARLGAITQVIAAGFFNTIGWIDLGTAAMSSAGTLSLAAILIAIDAYAESEYSRTNRRSMP